MKCLSKDKEKKAADFMEMAAQIALNSKCFRARCGTLIIKNDEIIGKGFNSPPNNLSSQNRCSNSKDQYDKKVTDKTCCVHAEQRAIMDALAKNPEKVKGSSLYFIRINEDGKLIRAGKPYCTICSKMALDTGIKEFILWHEQGICVYNTDEYNTVSFQYKG